MLTYAEQTPQDSLEGITRVLTWMFVLELLAKLVGLGPSEFFTGPEAGFNCFDCVWHGCLPFKRRCLRARGAWMMRRSCFAEALNTIDDTDDESGTQYADVC